MIQYLDKVIDFHEKYGLTNNVYLFLDAQELKKWEKWLGDVFGSVVGKFIVPEHPFTHDRIDYRGHTVYLINIDQQ